MKLPILLAMSSAMLAQPGALTLSQAVENAVKNYPSIRVSQEQVNAAAAGIELARTAYLPRVDTLAQVNVATRNNVFGTLLPQSVIPSISGPVLGTNNSGLVWGSAVGALVSWEPFDFALAKWPVRRSRPTLFVPRTAVVTTAERMFVVRSRNGHAEWVDVRKGVTDGDLVEVTGGLQAGDQVVRRATDELHDGSVLPSAAK
jgi:hypothetical protein